LVEFRNICGDKKPLRAAESTFAEAMADKRPRRKKRNLVAKRLEEGIKANN